MEKVRIVGLDIAKNSFHAHGAAEDGSRIFSKAVPRGRVLEIFGQMPNAQARRSQLRSTRCR